MKEGGRPEYSYIEYAIHSKISGVFASVDDVVEAKDMAMGVCFTFFRA